MSGAGAGADASDLDAALARLSGPDIVARLRTTCRRADYDAAARVLADRDRRLARAEAALAKELPDLLAEVQAVEARCLELKAKESRGPSSGAIAAAAPRVGRRAEAPGREAPTIDLSSSSDDDEELEEGEFRPTGVAGSSSPAASKGGDEGRRAGVSCQRKQSPASKGEEERTPAGVSSKRTAPASSCSPDDEDDRIPLSQLFMKKRRRAQRAANGKPSNGHGKAQGNSAGLLGADRCAISPVNRGTPVQTAALFVQRTRNGQSGKNGGLFRTMPSPPPTGCTAGNSLHKNCSKPDGSEGQARIGVKQGPVVGPKNDAPVQVRTPKVMDTVRRIVGSARVGAERPMDHTDSSTDGIINVVLHSIEGQGKATAGVHKPKVSLETNGTGNKASIMLKDTREQGKPDGQVLHPKVLLSRTDGIREQVSKLIPCQSPVDTHGGRPTTSDKPVSTTLQLKNQLVLHSEQVSVETSLPSEVTSLWKSSSAVFTSCLGNKELCMQAACALHRQKKFTTQPTVGGITKYEAHRMAMLAEFLLDGNLEGPLKRTAEDLEKHDSTGHDFLERVIMQCSEQLFSIYRNKDDKYFR